MKEEFEALFAEHPSPWEYKENYINGHPAIVDANGLSVVLRGQVSEVVFDAIWRLYMENNGKHNSSI